MSGDGITSPAEVRAADYPLLVTFADPADPTSVQRVDPANLAASFGPGVTLKRITVEVTNDPVTTGIEKRLGWLGTQRGALLNIPVSEYPPLGTPLPFAASITEGAFSQGGRK